MKKMFAYFSCLFVLILSFFCFANLIQRQHTVCQWQFDNSESVLYIYDEDACDDWIDTIAVQEIKKIVFDESIRYIPHDSFCNMLNLEEVVFSESLEGIGNYSFRSDPNLKDIYFPRYVSSIGICSFDEVTKATVSSENDFFEEKDGVIYSKDFSSVVFVSKLVENVVLPNSVKSIEDSAFYNCSHLKSVILSESLQKIGLYAFSGCSVLESIDLPDSLLTIKEYAFADCLSIKELSIPELATLNFISENYYFTGSGIKRLILKGNKIDLSVSLFNEDGISQVVCLGKPPTETKWDMRCPPYTIFYLNINKQYWAPNDEREWNGIHIVGIDSLVDLPSID